MAHIKIENLKYQYPFAEKLALDGITCEIRPGEFIGVIGRNGSGKSTFCQSLTGLVPNFYRGSYGGKVWIDQSEVKRVEVDDLCQKVGSVFKIHLIKLQVLRRLCMKKLLSVWRISSPKRRNGSSN